MDFSLEIQDGQHQDVQQLSTFKCKNKTGAALKKALAELEQRKALKSRVHYDRLDIERRMKRSLNSRHSQDHWRGCIAHPLDDYLVKSFYLGKYKQVEGDDDFDINFDGVYGLYYAEWEDEQLDRMHTWMVKRSLGVLRYSSASGSLFLEELEWFCTQHFDDVCDSIDLNANALRVALPKIIEQYHGFLPVEAELIMDDFRRLEKILVERDEYPRQQEEALSTFSLGSVNEVTSYEDFEDINHCIADLPGIKQILDVDEYQHNIDFINAVKSKFDIKVDSFGMSFKNYAKCVLEKAAEISKVAPKKPRKRKSVAKKTSKATIKKPTSKKMTLAKKKQALVGIATDLVLSAETLEELYGKASRLTDFKVELLSDKVKSIVKNIKKTRSDLDGAIIDLSSLASVLKEFCDKEDRKIGFKMELIADKVISLSKQLETL